MSQDNLLALLQKHWGYETFRPGQQEVITSVLQGRDTLAVFPTGGGKSLCYQLPALLVEGVVLVVSPLISLMQDQVASARARGISAACVHHEMSISAVEQCLIDAEYGRYRLLYVSPERLQSDFFRARLRRLKVALLAIDEAHCISEWGHQFRPAYRQLASVKEELGHPVVLAVTATATPEVRRDIIEQLRLRDPLVKVTGFDRPNIYWSVYYTENKQVRLFEELGSLQGESAIVYAGTRKAAEEWASLLTRHGFSAVAYHGGLDVKEREERMERWMSGEIPVMVATSAFGMGVDKPDVRLIVHITIPLSLEAYYQEAGRAGRDGAPSRAVILYGPGDRQLPEALLDAAYPSVREVRMVYDAVCNLAQIPLGERPEHHVAVDIEKIKKLTELPAQKIRTALELLQRAGYWIEVPPRKGWARVRMLQRPSDVRAYALRNSNRALRKFIDQMLRHLPGEAFLEGADVSLQRLSAKVGLSVERLMRGLSFLQEREILTWFPLSQAIRLEFTEPRVQTPVLDIHALRQIRKRAEQKLCYVYRYLATGTCRRRFLLSYFGEETMPACGACDVCAGVHRMYTITPEDETALIQLMRAIDAGIPPEHWFEGQPPYPHRIEGLLAWLLDQEWVRPIHPLEGQFALSEEGRERLQRTG